MVRLLADAPGEFQKVPIEVAAVQARFAGTSVQNRSEFKTAESAGEAAQTQSGNVVAVGEAGPLQQGGEGEGEWLQVMDQKREHDLLQLQGGKSAVLVDAEVPSGYYNSLRLKVAKMQVIVDGETHELKVPEEGIELAYKFQAEAGKGQELLLGFDVQQSIRKNAEGGYELKPVVEVKQLRYLQQSEGACQDAACQQQQAQPGVCQGEDCRQPTDPGTGEPASGGSGSGEPASGGSGSGEPASGGSGSSEPASGGSGSSEPASGGSTSGEPAGGGAGSGEPAGECPNGDCPEATPGDQQKP
jgi:hypothetical protein